MRIDETLEDIERADLEPALKDACVSIAEYLQRVDRGGLHFMPASYFFDQFDNSIDPELLIPALNILAATEHALLQVHGYLQRGEETPQTIEDDEFSDLLQTGELVDPESGEVLRDPWQIVHLYYSVRDERLV